MKVKNTTKEEILLKIKLLERNIAKCRDTIHHIHDKKTQDNLVEQIRKCSEEIKKLKLSSLNKI